jgi:hypothetical protein
VLSSSGWRYGQGREKKEGYSSAVRSGGVLELLFIGLIGGKRAPFRCCPFDGADFERLKGG